MDARRTDSTVFTARCANLTPICGKALHNHDNYGIYGAFPEIPPQSVAFGALFRDLFVETKVLFQEKIVLYSGVRYLCFATQDALALMFIG